MSEPTKIKWRIAGEEVVSCNCSWGCPCQFNALPTTGQCEATGAWQISDGYFGNCRLEGVRFAAVVWWPGAIHEGNGVWRPIVDEQATKEQRGALVALASGQHGGTYWEGFAAALPHKPEPLFPPHPLNLDRRKRPATSPRPGINRSDGKPVKNPANR